MEKQQNPIEQQKAALDIRSFLDNPTPKQNILFRVLLMCLIKLKRESLQVNEDINPIVLDMNNSISYDTANDEYLINGAVWDKKPSTLAKYVQILNVTDTMIEIVTERSKQLSNSNV